MRYGFISTPSLATVAANIASCSGVTVVSCCPIASKAVNDLSFSAVKLDSATFTPAMSAALGLFRPKFVAIDLIVLPPRSMPSCANGVLQDWANAKITGVWPDPSPHCSLLSLLSRFPLGRWSGCGEAIFWSGFRVESWLYQAELVTILNVEPGGRVVWVALFSSGLGFCLLSCVSTALSFW